MALAVGAIAARQGLGDADTTSTSVPDHGFADGPGLAFSLPMGETGADPVPSPEFMSDHPTMDTRKTASANIAHFERPRPLRGELLCSVSYSVEVSSRSSAISIVPFKAPNMAND